MPTFTLPITPPDSRSSASTPPRGLESHPDCGACRSRSSSPTQEPKPKQDQKSNPTEPQQPKSTSDLTTQSPPTSQSYIPHHVRAFAEENPVIAGIIALPVIIITLLYLPVLLTSLTPYHYLFPEYLPTGPPHPGDLAAATSASNAIASQIEAAMLRAAGGPGSSPFTSSPLLAPLLSTSPAEPQPPPDFSIPTPTKPWIPFPKYLLLQGLFTLVATGCLRRPVGYWLFQPLHIHGTRLPCFPEEAVPTLGGVDPSARLMTLWFFLHPREENLLSIMQTSVMVMILFCGLDSFTAGEFGSWMGNTGLARLLPFSLVVYLALVVAVFALNRWVILKAVVSDVGRKCAQVIWKLVGQWADFLGGVFWTVEGVALVGLLVLGGLVVYTVALPWDDEVWEPIRKKSLMTTSASLMGVADVLFDWAGVDVRGVVADFRAVSTTCTQACCGC